jgi:cyanophycinase-like exopeptidase
LGGDVLVLTADDAPCDVYNDLIYNLNGTTHLRPNSVTTACFTGRSGSYDKRLKQLLDGASMVFITGGDQDKYYDYWRDSPVSSALAQLTRPASLGGMGRPLGGSSAGLAVQGEYCYVAEHGPYDSPSALQDPLQMALAPSFLDLATPWMRHVVTDTHFMQRDRMGRLVAFLAIAVSQGWIHEGEQTHGVPGAMGIGVSEHTAVLLDAETGIATLAGVGPAYFLTTEAASPSRCESGEPLEFEKISTWRWQSSDGPASFDFGSWQPASHANGKRYWLTASKGNITSTGNHGAIY